VNPRQGWKIEILDVNNKMHDYNFSMLLDNVV
jgi:hypothetical protein